MRAGTSHSERRDVRPLDEPTLPVAAVARRLGVAPATLRTWDRRYGVGPSGHTNGRHRRYGPLDVARLEVMQRALLSGASTAEAARYALETVQAAAHPPVPEQTTSREAPDPPLDEPDTECRMARRLSAAALALDVRQVQQTLSESIAADGPAAAWEHVIRPVLEAIQQGWRTSPYGIESEYLLTELAVIALGRATPVVHRPRIHHPVLLAAMPAERNCLPVYALAADLARCEIDPMAFGLPLPADALVATVRRATPAAVVLWAQRPDTANAALFRRVARGRQRSRLFACGPGWEQADLPEKVELLGPPPAAVRRIAYVLLG